MKRFLVLCVALVCMWPALAQGEPGDEHKFIVFYGGTEELYIDAIEGPPCGTPEDPCITYFMGGVTAAETCLGDLTNADLWSLTFNYLRRYDSGDTAFQAGMYGPLYVDYFTGDGGGFVRLKSSSPEQLASGWTFDLLEVPPVECASGPITLEPVQPDDPQEMIEALMKALEACLPDGTPPGIRNSLNKPLEGAYNKLKEGDTDVAIEKLESFINEVEGQKQEYEGQPGKHIPPQCADELIAKAQEIIQLLSG